MFAAGDVEELLRRKAALEAAAAANPELARRLGELRTWQAARLSETYRDYSSEPRYAAAVEFFLSDLYSAPKAARRDNDLRRAWRYFKRTLPRAVQELLRRAVTLDVLSAELDQAMAGHSNASPLTNASYGAAYRRTGRTDERRRQIELLIGIGEDLDRLVRRSWIGVALRAAHVPAHAAGFGALQDFLETGFAAFRKMQGARGLLGAVRERETQMMETWLGAEGPPQRTFGPARTFHA